MSSRAYPARVTEILGAYSRAGAQRRRPLFWLAIAGAGAAYGALFCYVFPFWLLELTLPLLLLAVATIWALPETRNPPTTALTVLFFAFFVGGMLWPDYLALSLPGLPWITMRRIIAVPMLILFTICLSTSPRVRSEIKETLAAAPTVWKLLVAFVLIQLLTIALSRKVGFSIDRFIVAQLYWTLPFFVGCYVFRKPGQVAKWVAIFCLMSVPLALLGLAEWSREQVIWAGRIPSFLAIEDENVQRILQGASRAATHKYRVQSTSTTSLSYAEFLALTTPFLIHYMVGRFSHAVRLAALAGLAGTYVMIVATDSRLGVTGFLLSFLLYFAIWGVLLWRRQRDSLVGPFVTLAYPVIFVVFYVSTLYVGRLRRMVWGGGEHQFSTDARKDQYAAGFDILLGNPLGHGPGMGAETLGFFNLAGILTIDTYYLLIALEYGVIGFLLYYGLLLAGVFHSGRKLWTSPEPEGETAYLIPMIVAVIVFIVIKSVFSQETNHYLVFMMLAAMLALIGRRRRAREW